LLISSIYKTAPGVNVMPSDAGLYRLRWATFLALTHYNALVLKQVSFLLKEMLTWLGSPSTPSSHMIPVECSFVCIIGGLARMIKAGGRTLIHVVSLARPSSAVPWWFQTQL
jgi:hypothetical protein